MLNIPEEIKEKLHTDSVQKNIRIHFPNGERSDICNDLIVRNSVKFTESLCSQDTLKFGLCESPVFECETVGVENIKDATIEVYCEIFGDVNTEDAVFRADIQAFVYPIPLGTFVVAQCDRQADILHRKVVAYNSIAVSDWRMPNDIYAEATQGILTNTPYSYDLTNIILKKIKYQDFEKEEIVLEQYDTIRYVYNIYAHNLSIDIHVDGFRPRAGYYNIFSTNALYEWNPSLVVDSSQVFLDALDKFCDEYDISEESAAECRQLLINGNPGMNDGLKNSPFNLNRAFGEISIPPSTPGNTWHMYENIMYPYLPPVASELHCNPIIIPYQIDVQASSIGRTLYQFREFGTEHLYKLNHNFTSIMMSIPRIKKGNTYVTEPNKLSEIDLSVQTNALFELMGIFGNWKRSGGVESLNIKQKFGLTPSETLYPSSSLYPSGAVGGIIDTCDYQKCDYEDHYTIPFGLVACTFKDSSNQNIRYELWLTGFDAESIPETYQVYDISDNEIIKSQTWDLADIEAFCNTIADNIEGVTYVPMQLIGRGLPYVETGDTFTVKTKSNDSITTIVLNRTMQGEIALTDTYSSK